MLLLLLLLKQASCLYKKFWRFLLIEVGIVTRYCLFQMYLYSRYSSYRNVVKFTFAILLNYFLGTPYNLCITKINLWLIVFFSKTVRFGLPLCTLLATCLQFSYHCSYNKKTLSYNPTSSLLPTNFAKRNGRLQVCGSNALQNTHLLTQFQVFFTMYRFLSLLFSLLLFSQTKLIEASSNASPIDIGFCHLQSTVFFISRR